jgi:release factor glutamine methyltransferase
MVEVWRVGSTRREARNAAARLFRDAGLATPDLDARILLCVATGVSHEGLIADAERAMAPEEAARFAPMVERRLAGEPVSRICGRREFYGRSFVINAHTLDPRPDTETLIDTVLEIAAEDGWREQPLTIADLGTGSGAILITLLAELPLAHGIGVDLSVEALALAAENAARLGVTARAQFLKGDWLDGLAVKRFDLIVANPPYIPTREMAGLPPEVKDRDPHLALDGGTDGLDAYRRIAAGAAKALRPGGRIVLEIGMDQAPAVSGLLKESGFRLYGETGVRRDLAGRPRCLVAGLPGALPGLAERRLAAKKGLGNWRGSG